MRFKEKPWKSGEWPEAMLQSTMLYLRRSKYVKLPLEFKGLIPRNVEEATRVQGSMDM